ncbi:MAG TPA: EVE domain-containing protein [Alphaproteobacteria bacterium]|nr:EVE domain-containing protein [Alphaproteobacteria bacterium]
MAYWLMKSEPSAYSWQQFLKDKRTSWSGVRNYQANNNMKAMKVDDEAFFYHSNEDRAIVGIMKIVKTWHLDPSDETGKFGMVDVAPVKTAEKPLTLAEIKADKSLAELALLKQSRLSVSPITKDEWIKLLKLTKQ